MAIAPPPCSAAWFADATLRALQDDPARRLLDRLETRILLCHALGLSRVALITNDQRRITPEEAERLAALFSRRLNGEPIAYIVGEREFYGLPFKVTPAVLIPRPDTELLVELALARLPAAGRMLDLGTGSGAVAIAVAHSRPDATVHALDNSAAALSVARENAAQNLPASSHGVTFLHSDWYAALQAAAQFDAIAANPPYIIAGDPHLGRGDLRFEPQDALTDHADGLSALRRIIDGAPQHLASGGWLLMEHGYDQAAAVRAMLAAREFTDVQSWCDLAGIERVSGGRRNPS